METLYEKVADELVEGITQGLYQVGERLPGVRELSRLRGVSIATVVSAYRLLEDRGLVAARDRSGFFVKHRLISSAAEPEVNQPLSQPGPVTGQELVLRLIQAANNPNIVQLGAAVPDVSFLPVRAIQRALIHAARQSGDEAINYTFPPGLPALRRQIARRMTAFGCATHPDEVVITNGCQEALTLALKVVTRPGDVVAVESPTFYRLLQVLDALGLEAVEIPAHPRTGISLEALELAISRWPVKACVVVPNFSNPLGFCMSDEDKLRLVTLLQKHHIPLIEDDVYGDLGFMSERPTVCKSMVAKKSDDGVFYCGSFSKTLSPGLRIGWIVPPQKYRSKIEYMKYVLNLATSTISQLAVADLLANGTYERHLRFLSREFSMAVSRMTEAVIRHFPESTKISRPEGGFVIWLELPEGVDSIVLAQEALLLDISVSPGPIFSASQKFKNVIRLSCACQWDARVETALIRLAGLISAQSVLT